MKNEKPADRRGSSISVDFDKRNERNGIHEIELCTMSAEPKLRAFVLVTQLSTAYPQPAETHHDRIMNRTAAVVTRVCQRPATDRRLGTYTASLQRLDGW